MAERIGEAYVRVFFRGDNSGLKRDTRNLEKEIAKEEPAMKKAGKGLSTSLWDGLDEEWTKRMRKRFANNETAWNNHIANWKRDTGKIVSDTEKLLQKFDAAEKSHFDTIKKRDDVSIRSIGDQLMLSRELRNDIAKTQTRWERFRFAMTDSWNSMQKALKGLGPAIANAFLHPIDSVRSLSGWLSGLRFSLDGILLRFPRVASAVGRLGGFFTRTGTSLDTFGNKIGKVFGAGARNNFLNIFGKAIQAPVEGFARLFQIGGKFFNMLSGVGTPAIEDATKAAEEMGKELSSAGEGASGLASAAEEASASLGPVGLAAAAIAVVGAVQLAASGVMLLTGAVIALASSLSFALIGAIGAVVVALAPLGVALGTVVLAFQGLQNSKGKATGALQEIGKQFKALGKIAAQQIFTPDLMGGLSDMLKQLTPLIKETASWIGGLGQSFFDAANGPGGKAFMHFLGRQIPQMLQLWTPILKNAAKFLGELFIAATPIAKQFLGWLGGITQSLADLGGGKGGAKKLKDFFDSAWQSVQHVGDAIGQLIGLMGDLLFNKDAKKAGDSMFQSLADNIKKFRDYLASPEGQKAMKELFRDGRKLANAIGDAVVAVGKFIAALDTPQNRTILIFMVRAFAFIVKWVARMLVLYGKAQALLLGIIGKVGKLKGLIEGAGRAIQRAWNHALDWIGNRLSDLRGVAGRVTNAIGNFFANAGDRIAGAIRSAGNRIQTVWNSVTSAIKTGISNAASWVSGKISDIVGWFASLPGKILNINWGSVGKSIGDAIKSAISTAMSGLPGDIVQMFSGLASRILSAIGSINIGSLVTGPAKLLSKVGLASGGLVVGPQMRLVGEAGPEAVVPLARPLNQVDPAVRALSAIAQGKALGGVATVDKGRRIDVGGITVITPVKDPAAVATQVVNRIAASSYI